MKKTISFLATNSGSRAIRFSSLLASLVLLISSFSSNHIRAQFYGEFLYPHDSTFLTSAQRTVLDTGWVMAGFRPNFGQAHFVIDKVNKNGLISGPNDFSEEYTVGDPDINCSGFFNPAHCQGISVIESANTLAGNGYAVAGVYVSGNVRGVFFATLNGQGGVLNSIRWNLPGGSYGPTLEKPVVIESKVNPGDYYVCGHFNYQTYVMKVDNNALQSWANWYSINGDFSGFDIIESPYNPTSSKLIVVGRAQDNGGSTAQDAFVMHLETGMGNVLSTNLYSDGSGGDDWFNSISEANHSTLSNRGYVVGGFAHSSTLNNYIYTPWMAHLDTSYKLVWSTLIQPSYGNNNTPIARQCAKEINDVFQRRNQSGQFEYYGIAGSAMDIDQVGTNGFEYSYMSVFRLDNSGSNSLSPDEFRYFNGSGQYSHFDPHLTQIESTAGGGAPEGFQAFCTATASPSHYMVKAYYNGYAGCQDSLSDINVYSYNATDIPIQVNMGIFNSSCNGFAFANSSISVSRSTICTAGSVSGGSNSRILGVANVQFEDIAFEAFPNPVHDLLSLRFMSTSTSNIELKLLDLLGRPVDMKTTKGDELLTMEIEIADIQPGVYLLQVKDGERIAVRKIVVE